MSLVRLTEGQTNKIQIDEGIVVINMGEEDETILGPTRGGAEFTATPSIRDIEYDGRMGKTKGLQIKDGEDIELKVNTLNCSQEILELAIPNASIDTSSKKIEQGDFGLIKSDNYLKNVSIITNTLDGNFKILQIKNAMHEGAFGFKAVQKSENEHNLDFFAHYNYLNPEEKIWFVEESTTNPIEVG